MTPLVAGGGGSLSAEPAAPGRIIQGECSRGAGPGWGQESWSNERFRSHRGAGWLGRSGHGWRLATWLMATRGSTTSGPTSCR
eukprot:4415136-Alexandrium_andersonii.AAC.1